MASELEAHTIVEKMTAEAQGIPAGRQCLHRAKGVVIIDMEGRGGKIFRGPRGGKAF